MTQEKKSRNRSPGEYGRFEGIINERASDSVPYWPRRPEPKRGAPNVIVMLMDDMGFSDISPFGSEIDTPTLAELAESGYRLSNYQTPPMCAPARASLMTGLNPHRAGFSYVPHIDPGYPNSVMELPEDSATLAENFRAGGYATFMVGKWHLTVESKMHDAADKSSWPCQRGFDRYYGCMDGFTSLFHPHRLVMDNTQVVIDQYPDDYYLTDDMTDRAMEMISSLRANDPAKPFFLYFAHTAVHGPVQAKAEDMEKYRGRYESGWDHIRSERFARQVREGLFPAATVCAPRNDEAGFEVVPWDSLDDDQKYLFARYMEAYAAAVDNVDQNLKRLIGCLKRLGEYENTIVLFTSDNGGTAEGGAIGTRSYFSQFGRRPEMPDEWQTDVPRDPELIGGPQTFVHYPRGWAYASNTPFRLYKTHTYGGGVRVPMVISWPAGLPRSRDDDGIRNQYAYATDIAPTLMALAGVDPLTERNGHVSKEVDGLPFDEWLRDSALPSRHTEQYVELNGRRAFLDGHWKAISPQSNGPGWDEHAWELYDLATDPTELYDLANQYPDRVRALAERWKNSAWQNQVFPLNDDGSMFRIRPSTELTLEQPVTLFPGVPTLERFRSSKLTKLRSFLVEVQFDHRSSDAGVLVAHGDQGGGYVISIQDKRLHISYNQYGEMVRSSAELALGQQTLRVRFDLLPGLKWLITAESLGKPVLAMEPVLQLAGMSPFTGISVGLDRGGPVDWDLYQRFGCFKFNGNLKWVRYTPGRKSEHNTEQIVDIEREVARIYE